MHTCESVQFTYFSWLLDRQFEFFCESCDSDYSQFYLHFILSYLIIFPGIEIIIYYGKCVKILIYFICFPMYQKIKWTHIF